MIAAIEAAATLPRPERRKRLDLDRSSGAAFTAFTKK
jgi:hypothetical protein